VTHYQLRFRKFGDVRFLSHLDLMEQWKRALRRAELPIAFSAGFNPQPKLSLLAPLPVGTESECEVLFVELENAVPADELRSRLQPNLPAGVEIVAAKTIYARPGASDLEFTYRVEMPAMEIPTPERIAAFLGGEAAVVERQRKGETRKIDVVPFVREIVRDGDALMMRIVSTDGKTVRPEEVLEAMGATAPGRRGPTRIVRLTTEYATRGENARA
jgi:radical SAM-linked protein